MEINLAISGLDELVGLLGCFGILNSLHLPLLLLCVSRKSSILISVPGNIPQNNLGQIHDVSKKTWKNRIPSRELTYPTWGKGKSSSKCHFWGICLVPWRVFFEDSRFLYFLCYLLPFLNDFPWCHFSSAQGGDPGLGKKTKSNWYETHWNTTQTLIFNIHDIHDILKIYHKISICSKNVLFHHVWYPFILDR